MAEEEKRPIYVTREDRFKSGWKCPWCGDDTKDGSIENGPKNIIGIENRSLVEEYTCTKCGAVWEIEWTLEVSRYEIVVQGNCEQVVFDPPTGAGKA